jgi:hypothetical protein
MAVAMEYFNKTQNNRRPENFKHFYSLRFDNHLYEIIKLWTLKHLAYK